MPYNFVADSFHMKKLCSRLSSSKVRFYQKTAVLRFWAPSVGLGATHDDHLRLIGKRVVDFLLVLIELFFASCYGWYAKSEYRLKIGAFVPTGPVDQKFHVKGVAPTNHSSSQKTRLNDLSYGIEIWTDLFFHFGTNHALAKRTDRRTEKKNLIARPPVHSMQRGNNWKGRMSCMLKP